MATVDSDEPVERGSGPETPTGLPDDFTADLGLRHHFDGDTSVVELPVPATLLTPDHRSIRAGALASVADLATGSLVTRVFAPRIPLTVSLRVCIAGLVAPESLVAVGRVVKMGRTQATLETEFRAPGTPGLIALSVVSFVSSQRPEDVFSSPIQEFSSRGVMQAPFAEQLGARVLEPGVVELERRSYVMQGSGSVQGGALALVAELAAESAVGSPVLDLDVRYLATVRRGPVRSAVRLIDPWTVRVEVVDIGDADRLAVLALARCR